MKTYYTNERNIQQLIYLMKANGIRKVIASPGSANVTFVASIQQDPYFEIYSSVDERSAAYMACGMAAESNEIVAISCTGATASRNYIPGLTEAFYRKLPILVITATQHIGRIGQNMPQVIDGTTPLNDMVKLSVNVPAVHDDEDEWANEIGLNTAILELRHHGGGPVHVNMTTMYSTDFSVKKLPPCRVINRILEGELFPEIQSKKIALFVGAHKKWSDSLTQVVDEFCEKYNAVVFCDHTSNYQGKYRIFMNLIADQTHHHSENTYVDILIDIGDISGAYMSLTPKEVWRINPDGKIRDSRKKMRYIFEMTEEKFFQVYVSMALTKGIDISFYKKCDQEYHDILRKIIDLPFSNIWMAWKTSTRLPQNSVIHFGILNSLRTWNLFEKPASVLGYSNTGGFGIDGGVSSLIGASIVNPEKLFFGVIGDLAFFYDLNSLGNRHIGTNLRLILVNNGGGTEFRNYTNSASMFGDDTNKYIAAGGHYGSQSPVLVKGYAEALGFEYISANNKEEYLEHLERFLEEKTLDKPILFEVFTNSKDESDAWYVIKNLEVSIVDTVKKKMKQVAKEILGDKTAKYLKKIIQK